MKNWIILRPLLLLTVSLCFAQTKDPSAILQLDSTTQGILPPRMTQTQMEDIASPATGLLVFCTDCNPAQLQLFNGSLWENVSSGTHSTTSIPLWQSLTNSGTYATNDIINYDGALYKNLSGTNSDTTPTADTTNWTPLLQADENAIDYQNTTYSNEDLVSYRGKLYRAKQNITSAEFASYSKTASYTTGDKVFHQGTIYSANQTIAAPASNGDYPFDTDVLSFTNAGWNNYTFRMDPSSSYGNPPAGNFQNFKVRLQVTAPLADLTVKLFDAAGTHLADRNASLVSDLGDKWYSYALDTSYTLDGTESIGFHIPQGNSIYNSTTTGYDLFYNSSTGDQSATNASQANRRIAFEIPSSGETVVNSFDETEWTIEQTLPGNNWRTFREGALATPLWISDTNGGVYASNDIVNHNGTLYKNLTGTNTDTAPNADTTNWMRYGTTNNKILRVKGNAISSLTLDQNNTNTIPLVIFDTVIQDTTGGAWDMTTNIFTANEAGLYRVTTRIRRGSGSYFHHLYWSKNNTTTYSNVENAIYVADYQGTLITTVYLIGYIQLDVNDTLTLFSAHGEPSVSISSQVLTIELVD